MYESILTSIKKMLGIESYYTHFDPDLIMYINSVFSILAQMGVGPSEGYSITGSTETWDDYIEDLSTLQLVKTYIYMKTRLMFDPPTSTSISEIYKIQIAELEWRLSTLV